MGRYKRALVISVGVVALSSPIVGIFVYRSIASAIEDMYAQWASAEMVIAYHKQHDVLPKDWRALEAFYDPDSPHVGGLTFDEIKARVTIHFSMLDSLKLEYPSVKVPEVIYASSGIQSHWEGAEPNRLVNQAISVRVE